MSNLSTRILSAAVLVPFVIFLVFFSSDFVLFVSLSLISSLACFEFTSISFSHRFLFHRLFISLLSGLLTFLFSFSFVTSNFLYLFLFLGFCSLIFPLLFMFLSLSFDTLLNFVSFSFFGVFYCGVLLGFLSLTSLFNPEDGRYLIFMLLLGTFMGDTGAYAFGRTFGKHKLYPKLSPGKTWEGSFGGFLCTFLSLLIVKFTLLPHLSFLSLLILSFFLSLFCQLGDLSESFLKRSFSVKDSGRIIPGHGGILDRIDALLFGAPIVFIFSLLR